MLPTYEPMLCLSARFVVISMVRNDPASPGAPAPGPPRPTRYVYKPYDMVYEQ